ncbi:MAG: tryptophan synthase subunit alpha [Burkholderiaceae bacterium]
MNRQVATKADATTHGPQGSTVNRIAKAFTRLQGEQRKALIPYVTAGFPYPDITPELMHGMVAAGADVIELGVPFSDPSADGAVIQLAGDKALAAGIGLAQVIEMVRVFRQKDDYTPVVLMGYANPVERYDQRHGPSNAAGGSPFVRDAASAGVDGLLIVDYPPEECVAFADELRRHGMDLIFLLAPTSTERRMAQVAAVASGYVYYVSLKGVTGAGNLDVAAVEAMLPRIREHVKLPLGVGFGIRDAQSACAVARSADAVVIGSRIIQLIGDLPRDAVIPAAGAFLQGIRDALDAQSATR